MVLGAVVVGAVGLSAGAVGAADNALPISWSYDTGAFGDPGTHLVLGSASVPAGEAGLACDVVVDIGNNDSIHPDSDITVTTGSDAKVFPDTEGQKGDPGPVTTKMVLGNTVTVTLTFGGDGVFSGSGTVDIGACVSPEPPVTVPTTTPVTPDVPVVVSPEVVVATPAAPTAVVVTPAFTG
jgi:hypothetical protein